jgi:hypothetical protein
MNNRLKAMMTLTAAVAILGLAGCATTNRLAFYDFRGATLSTRMRTPPAPRVNVDYSVTLNARNPILSGLSLLTNLAKAGQAGNAEAAMRDALAVVDIPEIVRQETGRAAASVLQAVPIDSLFSSDFLLDLDIHDWGIDASNPGATASLHMRLTARLSHTASSETLWARTISVDQSATSQMFGLGQIVGDMVTATALSQMTAGDLAAGFTELARESARKMVRILQRDLDAAWSG